MFKIFLLSIFFSTSSGLKEEENCLKQHFIKKSEEEFPKPGVQCSDSEVENRWRGELIYEQLNESNTGIDLKWKHLVQNPHCPRLMKLFVNNRWVKNIYPKNIHRNVESVELRERETFELKIQVLYHEEPKCLEASTTINPFLPRLPPLEEDNKVETGQAMAMAMANNTTDKTTEDSIAKDTTNETSATINIFFSNDDYKNTIIISLSSLLIIIMIVFSVIAIVMWRRIREGIMKVDDNIDVYRTYYMGEVEYSEVKDSNPYYGN